MKIKLDTVKPEEIEKRSFEIIGNELKQPLDPKKEPIIKRVIHTTADFSYADTLVFSENAIDIAIAAIKQGASIVTDTNMVKAGINKKVLEQFGGSVHCFIGEEEIAKRAKENGTTRAVASMEKAAELSLDLIFAIGNAPTALIRLYEMMEEGFLPKLIIGVPVGFVNVVESKELILTTKVPFIVARGRKGGSNVAAAICNALLYQCRE